MNTALQLANKLMSSIGLNATAPGNARRSRFNRDMLPSPETFWASYGITLKSRQDWVMATCIFHDDHHPSLAIYTDTGGFYCHSCGAKGGDVVSAYRLLTGCDFVTAVKTLDAWEE